MEKKIISFFGELDEEKFWQQLGKMCSKLTLCVRTDQQLYVYQQGDELLCILVDAGNKKLETGDETMFQDELPLYYSSSSHRISPVYYLWQATRTAQEVLGAKKAMALLLTDTCIKNLYELWPYWNYLHVLVRTNLSEMPVALPHNGEEWNGDRNGLLQKLDFAELERKSAIAAYKYKLFEKESDSNRWHTPCRDGKVNILIPINNGLKELQQMVNMEGFQEFVKRVLHTTECNRLLQNTELEGHCKPISKHVFLGGHAGTGKRTLAHLYASILWDYGLVDSDEIVMADKHSFLTKYGWEEAVNNILDLAKDGVLIVRDVDEILEDEDAREVIPEICERIMQNKEEQQTVLVLCGNRPYWPEEAANNRMIAEMVTNCFYLPEPELTELAEILYKKANQMQYEFTDPAWRATVDKIEREYRKRNASWRNAKEVTELWEKILKKHTERCIRENIQDRTAFLEITPEDVSEGM